MPSLLERLKNGDNDDATPVEYADDFPAELADEIVPDPTPGKAKPRGGARASSPTSPASRRPVSAAVKRRVTDELEAYAKMAALAWSIRDEHCGPILNEQSRAIAESLAELIARNPALVRWVETSGVVGDWMKLWMAIAPVVSAVRAHHIVKSVPTEEEGTGVDYSRYSAYRPSA